MAATGIAPSRIGHAAVATAALIGLAIEVAIVLGYPADEIPMRAIRLLSFFTILTNGIIAAASLGIAWGKGALCRRAERPGTRAAATLYILVVAIIFHLLLRDTIKPGLLHHWGNVLLHQIVPALWLGAWLGFGPHGGIDAKAPLRWLIYPLLFAAWTLVHGALAGWYPYPFMDVARFGYPIVLRNMAVIALVFLGLGYGVWWVDGRLGRRATSALNPPPQGGGGAEGDGGGG